MLRDGSDENTIRNIIASQIGRDDRLAAADDVIHNEGPVDASEKQVHELHAMYLKLAGANE
jgi:dephospho-CoA kinase